jgi:topoisomerase-4 subunit A
MLVFKVADVPEMPKGKGNKLYDIPSKKAASREELMVAVTVVAPKTGVVLWQEDKSKTLEWSELKTYIGERAQRGSTLPRGWKGVDRLEPIPTTPPVEKEKG